MRRGCGLAVAEPEADGRTRVVKLSLLTDL
jgi:hypothetical protein